MRTICLAMLDKTRPVVVLSRDVALSVLTNVTVAPITTTVRGLAVEVAVGERNGLDGPSVISCDNVQTVPRSALGRVVGVLLPEQEGDLAAAISAAFDLV
jgi:mRNA interferase MazF